MMKKLIMFVFCRLLAQVSERCDLPELLHGQIGKKKRKKGSETFGVKDVPVVENLQLPTLQIEESFLSNEQGCIFLTHFLCL